MDFNFLIFWIILALVFGTIFLIYKIWEKNKRDIEVKRVLNTRFFLVTLPREVHQASEREPAKDFRQLVGVAEQMFTAFASLYSHELKNKILQEQEQVSFEIISRGNLVSFYIVCPKMLEEMVARQVQAYYPTAHLDPVPNPNIFRLSKPGSFSCATFKLNKKYVLPLKTYLNLESDPLSGVTNAMSKLGEDENAAFQIILQPANELWRSPAYAATKKIQEGKTSISNDNWLMKLLYGSFDLISDVLHGASAPKDIPAEIAKDDAYKPLSPIQESLLKAINEKISKNGFKVAMRLVTTGSDKLVNQASLKSIASAFAQFGTPELNSFKLKSGDHQVAKDFILRRMPRKAMILNTEELATLWHLPSQYVETPNIRWLLAKEMAPPQNLPTEGIILGKSVYRGEEMMVRIKTDDRRRHMFMIGKTGVGKTTTFTNMIEQDILAGHGCCYLDPNGDAIEDILGKIPQNRVQDVILFDPADTQFPLGLNMLEWKNPEDRDFLIQESIEMFYKLFDPNRTGMVGAQWEHWFRNAALTVMSQPGGGTIIDIPRIFTDDAYRAKLVSYVTDPVVKKFWDEQLAKTADFHKSEMYNYFISKFGRFMTNDLMRNIIGQKKSSFNIREAMDTGKIILINLSKGKIGEMNSSLLGMILVTKIQVAAFSRADIPQEERRDFYLYVDEFQNFTTDTFQTILSEARKYRLNLNITNQYIAQLTDAIRDAVIGNAGTIISYRIGAADAEFLIKEFPDVSVQDMTNLDAFNTYVKLLIDGTPSKPFSMKGIMSQVISNPQARDQIKTICRQKYGRPVEQVNQEFAETLKIGQSTLPPAGANEPFRNL